jgi:NAD(P)-dependent dehydrogenase (short-subunit alcohol dehydrogenase family)
LAFTVKKALSLLNDGGAIIVITSIAENKGIPGFTAYSATQAAVRSFVRTWTAELKDRRIWVNAISPGPIDTPIFEQQAPTKEGAAQARAQFAAAVVRHVGKVVRSYRGRPVADEGSGLSIALGGGHV